MIGSPASAAMMPRAAHAPSVRRTGQRETVFKGETLRGLLLTSFGFSEFGNKASQGAVVTYLAAALLALLSIAGFVHALVTPKTKGFAVPEPVPAVDAEVVTA